MPTPDEYCEMSLSDGVSFVDPPNKRLIIASREQGGSLIFEDSRFKMVSYDTAISEIIRSTAFSPTIVRVSYDDDDPTAQ